MSKGTWLDRAIAWMAPGWGFNRVRARMAANILMSYEGARTDRRASGWSTTDSSADAEIGPTLSKLRQRSRDLVRNNAYAARAIGELAGQAIGTGITAMAKPAGEGNAALAKEINEAWRIFIDECDADGQLDLYGLQRLGARTVFESGQTGRNKDVDYTIGPNTVSPDGDNLVFTDGSSVQVWNPTTHTALEQYWDFALPMNAIRFQADLVVAELMTGSVVRQSASSGDRITLASELIVPIGLAATKDSLWVSDWATGTVWQIVAGGVLLATPTAVATGLSNPEGLAVDLDGSLLVVESGAGRLSRINLVTGVVSPVAEKLRLGTEALAGMWWPSMYFNGVAVGPSGTIYVTGDVADVLYRFRPDR